MNPFLLPEKERMLSWRELRHLISSLSDENKFEPLLEWWSKAPICAYSIDAYDCTHWPTPWELLNENNYCTSAVGFMMAQTLILSGFDKSRIKLVAIKSSDDERLVVVIDSKIVLNYSYAEAFHLDEINTDFEVRESYVMTGDKFEPIIQI
jgi:hypothetical protein